MLKVSGKVLVDEYSVLVKSYLGLLGFLGAGFGIYTNSAVIAALGAVLLGLWIAPLAPVWEEKNEGRIRYLRDTTSGRQMRFYFWLIPACLLFFIILSTI